MNRSAVATRLGVALLAVGALICLSVTLGFATDGLERTSSVGVADDADSYLGVTFQGSGENPRTFDRSVGESFDLVELTNRFEVPLSRVDVTVDARGTSGGDAVAVTSEPGRIRMGGTGTVRVECRDETDAAYETTAAVRSEDGSVEARLVREIGVTCAGTSGG